MKIPKSTVFECKIKISDQNWVENMSHFAKTVKGCKFSDHFQKFQKNPGKLEFWNSELKIELSDQNWVGKIPNMLKLVKNQPISANFPKSQFPIPKSQKISGNIKSVKNYCKYGTVISSIIIPQKSINIGKNVKSCYSSM